MDITDLYTVVPSEWTNLRGESGVDYHLDPWAKLGATGSYNAEVDANFIGVLKGIRDHKFNSTIAEELGLSPSHVELIQYLVCGAGWGEYGTSPRGCWPAYGINFDQLIEEWERYAFVEWVGTAGRDGFDTYTDRQVVIRDGKMAFEDEQVEARWQACIAGEGQN